MSSKFSLQTPYVVASLPRPIDHQNGRYVVGEVYGGLPGTKKRKRAELAVGIDGEGVNLYDIASSRLITSYALPPQSTFTCPPASTRTKTSKSKIDRRTYASTTGTQAQLSLFCEASEGPAASTSTTVTRNVENSTKPIVFLGTVTATRGTNTSESTFDLLAVKEDGEIQCYDGESLKEKWTSLASTLVRDDPSAEAVKVEFAQLTNAHSASQGILKGRQDALAIFPQEIAEDEFNPELLVLITKSSTEVRTLHIVSMPRRSQGQIDGTKQSVESLLAVELPTQASISLERTSFSLQASTGLLQQLSGNSLYTFDLTDTIPKVTSKLNATGAQSFLRLSNTSVMISSDSVITVFNPKYQSILATVNLDDSSKPDSLKRKRGTEATGISSQTCEFVAYFPKLGSAVAVSGNDLIAVQVEGQLDRQGRPRATGLLIDSLGCSVKEQSRPSRSKRTKSGIDFELKTMDLSAFGSASNEQPWNEQIASLEDAAANGDVIAFDDISSSKFGVDLLSASPKVNGDGPSIGVNGDKPQTSQSSPIIDRRWTTYALSKIFTVSDDDQTPKLSISFYPPKVFMWLLRKGKVTATNIEMALRDDNTPSVRSLEPGNLVDALVELDPTLDLLLVLVSENHLSASELLHAIRRLMESLGLFGEDTPTKQALLTNGDELDPETGDAEEQLMRLEAEAENDLAMAEYQLGSGSGVRGQALSVALSKLYTCPNAAIIYGIQTSFIASETVSLIYLLRYELARGAWTSRYLDNDESNIIDEDAEIPNNAIILIASLLNNCVDAIGAGGWLTGQSRLLNGDPFEAEELIASLKLEVGAALEGIEEAKYLSGLISEMVRYGDLVQKAGGQTKKDSDEAPVSKKNKPSKPMILPQGEQEKLLPLGLKADQLISNLRVGAGGEVQSRSKRDIGHLKSLKVGKYTLERIVV